MSNTEPPETTTLATEAAQQTSITIEVVRAEYERADCFHAEVQSFKNAAGIPALNELRNAGKHLLDAIDNDGAVVSESDLHSALSHARRASYEAYEAGILTALGIINKFKTDYQSIVISQVVPRYAEIMQKAKAAQKAIEDGRKKGFNREQDHTDRMHAFRELRDACEHLDANRDEANKVVIGERKSSRNTTFGITLAILGIILGLPSFVDWVGQHDWAPAFARQSDTGPPEAPAKK